MNTKTIISTLKPLDNDLIGNIVDPMCQMECELIISGSESFNPDLIETMLNDVLSMKDETITTVTEAMFSLHLELVEECGDLDVSVDSAENILKFTEPQYVIFDSSSTQEQRIVRYHFICSWETGHGAEAIIINGNKVVFVGSCGGNAIDSDFNYI